MKTHYKFQFTRRISYHFFRNRDENLAVCGDFIDFALRRRGDSYHANKEETVSIDVRTKNPKERDFIRLEVAGCGRDVIAKIGKQKKGRFYMCSDERLFMKNKLQSPKMIWVRVKEIA